jgi:hypothetical protein
MVMTTLMAELAGVIAPAGLNKHCASEGNPEQESVMAASNEVPTG